MTIRPWLVPAAANSPVQRYRGGGGGRDLLPEPAANAGAELFRFCVFSSRVVARARAARARQSSLSGKKLTLCDASPLQEREACMQSIESEFNLCENKIGGSCRGIRVLLIQGPFLGLCGPQ